MLCFPSESKEVKMCATDVLFNVSVNRFGKNLQQLLAEQPLKMIHQTPPFYFCEFETLQNFLGYVDKIELFEKKSTVTPTFFTLFLLVNE